MFKFGIDWSEDHHNLCIRNDKGAIVSQVEFKHTLEGFQRFDDEPYTQRYDIATTCLRIGPVWFPEIGPSTKRLVEGIEEPEKNKDLIWSYVDVRDVVQIIRLLLEKVSEGWHVYNVGAEDVCTVVPSLDLVRRFYPDVELIRNAADFVQEPFRALWDISKAKEELGFRPQINWRTYQEGQT
jgi:nucleoside-diphosphate-sugar epimerase